MYGNTKIKRIQQMKEKINLNLLLKSYLELTSPPMNGWITTDGPMKDENCKIQLSETDLDNILDLSITCSEAS